MTNTPEGSAMSEIKQTEEVINKRFRGKPDLASDFAWKNEFKRERDELRAAYEALKAENEILRKQVAELKTETAKDHVKIMHLKDALSAYGDPDVFADDED